MTLSFSSLYPWKIFPSLLPPFNAQSHTGMPACLPACIHASILHIYTYKFGPSPLQLFRRL